LSQTKRGASFDSRGRREAVRPFPPGGSAIAFRADCNSVPGGRAPEPPRRRAIPRDDGYGFVQRAIHSVNVWYHSALFCGLLIQCPSSGNTSRRDGTPWRWSVVNSWSPSPTGTR
jgi:hypothetical protein